MQAPKPHSIAHLEMVARNKMPDIRAHDIDYYIDMVQRLHSQASTSLDDGEYEDAFIRFLRAATIVLELLPERSDYAELDSEKKSAIVF
ncbi:hypothetical protein C0991_011223, partial [Blastosporella zonata]